MVAGHVPFPENGGIARLLLKPIDGDWRGAPKISNSCGGETKDMVA
jgi:hypothetical protein